MTTAAVLAPGGLLASSGIGTVTAGAISVIGAAVALPPALLLVGPHLDRWRLGSGRAGHGRVVGLGLAALRRPVLAAGLVLALLLGLAAPSLALDMGSPDPRELPASAVERHDFDAIVTALPGGWTAPYEIVVARPDGPITDPRTLAALARWQRRIASDHRVRAVLGPDAIARRSARSRQAGRALSSQLGRGRRGLRRLSSGLERVDRGVQDLRGGLTRASAGARSLDAGGASASAGAARLSAGLGQASAGARRLRAGLAEARSGSARLASGAALAHRLTAAGGADLTRALAALDDMSPAAKADPGFAVARGAVVAAARQIAAQRSQLAAGLGQLEAGARRLETALASLERGGGELDASLARLRAGGEQLGAGVERLRAGAGQLAAGLGAGAERAAPLDQGVGGMRAGVQRMDRSSARLAASSALNPRLLDSGYATLAGMDVAPRDARTASTFLVNLDRGGSAMRVLVVEGGDPSRAGDPLRARLERETRRLERETGLRAAVGGPAATLQDFEAAASGRLGLLIAALVLVTYLVLVPVLRSLVLPLIAVALNVLTVAAAFGVLTLGFDGAAPLGGPGKVDAMMVLAIFAIVFGLSIDYEVFLLTRIREGYERHGSTRAAIEYGLRRTGGIITGAALIMSGVFVAFALSDIANMRELGVGLTVAVLLDATLVRLVLLPAAIRLAGDASWWMPRWLGRTLPRLDVEGAPRPRRALQPAPARTSPVS